MRLVKRGDTLIEVIFAISIFSLVAILSIVAMNSSINTAQATLEVTMARNEIDAQAEAIRFIHNSYLSERELVDNEQKYRVLWKTLTDTSVGGLSNDSNQVPDLTYTDCNAPYISTNPGSLFNAKAFIMNTRMVNPNDPTFFPATATDTQRAHSIIIGYRNNSTMFSASSLYPRVIFAANSFTGDNDNSDISVLGGGSEYRHVYRAEGIWVVSIAGTSRPSGVYAGIPEFYDFHIRTCWYAPGSNTPSTIGTIIRLYNPELVERAR